MPEQVKKWNFARAREVLEKAHKSAESALNGADRILQFPELTEACDWLVAQHYASRKTEARVVTLAHGVFNATKLFPPSGDPTGEKHYSVAHLGRFDAAVRALKDFIDKLAARAAKD